MYAGKWGSPLHINSARYNWTWAVFDIRDLSRNARGNIDFIRMCTFIEYKFFLYLKCWLKAIKCNCKIDSSLRVWSWLSSNSFAVNIISMLKWTKTKIDPQIVWNFSTFWLKSSIKSYLIFFAVSIILVTSEICGAYASQPWNNSLKSPTFPASPLIACTYVLRWPSTFKAFRSLIPKEALLFRNR